METANTERGVKDLSARKLTRDEEESVKGGMIKRKLD